MDLVADRRALVAAGAALWLLPLVGVLLVMFTSMRASGAIVWVALPLGSAALVYLLSRVLSVSPARSLIWTLACLVSCVVCNGCALALTAVLGL